MADHFGYKISNGKFNGVLILNFICGLWRALFVFKNGQAKMADHFGYKISYCKNLMEFCFLLLPHEVFETNTPNSSFEGQTVGNFVLKLKSVHYQFNGIVVERIKSHISDKTLILFDMVVIKQWLISNKLIFLA